MKISTLFIIFFISLKLQALELNMVVDNLTASKGDIGFILDKSFCHCPKEKNAQIQPICKGSKIGKIIFGKVELVRPGRVDPNSKKAVIKECFSINNLVFQCNPGVDGKFLGIHRHYGLKDLLNLHFYKKPLSQTAIKSFMKIFNMVPTAIRKQCPEDLQDGLDVNIYKGFYTSGRK